MADGHNSSLGPTPDKIVGQPDKSPSEVDFNKKAGDPSSTGKTGFGKVARKIRSRTTDLLAIAILLMGGLAVGKQIHSWWQADEDSNQSPQEIVQSNLGDVIPWGTDKVPVSLAFGQSPHAITRMSFQGERVEASAMLVQQCEGIAQAAKQPMRIPPVAHRKMLERLSRFKPVKKQGDWQVYRFDGPVFMATATKRFSHREISTDHPAVMSPTDTETAPYVVCWGVALPAGENLWTLFTFHSTTIQNQGEGSRLPVIEIPPYSRRIFSMRDDRGRGWITFRGVDSGWKQFHDNWFQKHGWKLQSSWQDFGNVRAATFRGRFKEKSFRVELSYQKVDRRGESTGTIIVTPLTGRNLKQTNQARKEPGKTDGMIQSEKGKANR